MADDDIIELTDIVKEGHAPAQAAPAAAEAPMPDFGADLDELLQNYDKPAAEAPVAARAEVSAAAPDEAVAAPIANQEVPDHTVDPNEELELPPLSDLDALLEELGVQDNAPIDTAPQPTLADDLDAMPSPDLAAPASAAPAAPDATAAAQAKPAAQAAAPADDDGIDLNELDALLDSVLASAPKPAPAAAAAPPKPEATPARPAPEQAAPAQQPDTPLASTEAGTAALQAEVAALRAELDDLRANIDKYAAAAAAKVIREELAVIAANLD